MLSCDNDYPLALFGVREGPRESRARDILGPGMERRMQTNLRVQHFASPIVRVHDRDERVAVRQGLAVRELELVVV